MKPITLDTGEKLDPQAVRFMRAIRTKESGGNYDAIGDAGTSTGAFQFQKATWQRYTKEVLGDGNAVQDKANQNKVAYTKVKNWKDAGKSPEWIAAAWNAGEGRAESGAWRTNRGTTTINGQDLAYDTPKYVSDVISIAKRLKQQEGGNEESFSSDQEQALIQPDEKKPNLLKRIGGALISSEKNFGQSLAAALPSFIPGSAGYEQRQLDKSEQKKQEIQQNIIAQIQKMRAEGEDTSRLEQALQGMVGQQSPQIADIVPSVNKTAGQIFGEGAGVGLDILTAGTYGNAIKGAKTGSLLAKIPAVGTKGIPTAGNIIRQGANASIAGAGIGYGYDVTQGLQEGEGAASFKPGIGAAFGAVLPGGFAAAKLAKVGAREASPKLLNSLIGSNKDFNKSVRFGNNPGETVAKYAITANDLPQLEQKISAVRQQVGELIGGHLDLPQNAVKRQDFSDIVRPLDEAISKAKKNEASSQPLIARLQNAKSDIIRGKNLADMSPREAFSMKQQLKDLMKFTGAPSDDIGVNGALNGVYGKLTEKINKAVPELIELNKDYGGLLGAELSAGTRAERDMGKSLLSLGNRMSTLGGVGVGLATGGGINALLYGLIGAALDKVLGSTAVKTRLAKWLGGAANEEIQAVLRGKMIGDQKKIIQKFNEIIKEENIDRPLLELPSGEGKNYGKDGMKTIQLPSKTQSTIDQRSADAVRSSLQGGAYSKGLPNKQGGFVSTGSTNPLMAGAAVSGAGVLGLKSLKSKKEYPKEEPKEEEKNADPKRFLDAIAYNETNTVKNPYSYHKFSGDSDLGEDMGRYQVTEGELKTYAKRYLGYTPTKAEFLASPKTQDDYMKGKYEYLKKQGYSDAEIADIHRNGIKNSRPKGKDTYQSPKYVTSFLAQLSR